MVICWDESRLLTDDIVNGESWTRFSELRRSLRKIRKLAIFSVLSTAGNFHFFSRNVRLEPSNRISTLDLEMFSPITEVGFDEFAIEVNPTSGFLLAEVASTYHMAHLGRYL